MVAVVVTCTCGFIIPAEANSASVAPLDFLANSESRVFSVINVNRNLSGQLDLPGSCDLSQISRASRGFDCFCFAPKTMRWPTLELMSSESRAVITYSLERNGLFWRKHG